jgi:hypothetical protein
VFRSHMICVEPFTSPILREVLGHVWLCNCA